MQPDFLPFRIPGDVPLLLKQALKHHTTHAEHKAFQSPFVSLLNLTIVPPRQSTDTVWMDLLRPPDVEATPSIFPVNVALMSSVCVCVCVPNCQSRRYPRKQHITGCSNTMVTAPDREIQSIKGKVWDSASAIETLMELLLHTMGGQIQLYL